MAIAPDPIPGPGRTNSTTNYVIYALGVLALLVVVYFVFDYIF